VNAAACANDPEPITFWDALTPVEQNALTSVATRRTYPAGATIFREGEAGDHVVVIRSGWTKICVHENGKERLVAERGPGQLVGERAALRRSVRSRSSTARPARRASRRGPRWPP
jgi:CRP-like cAMP-binding protein